MARLFDDGSSEYLSVGSAVVSGVPLSMACWMNCDDDTASLTLMTVGQAGTNNYFWLIAAGDKAGDPIRAYTRDAGDNEYAETSSGYTAGMWHHACAVYSAVDSRAVYIDGGSKGTESTSITPAGLDTTWIARGAPADPWGFHFSGMICEAAIWTAALSDAEVAVLGLGYSPLFVRRQNLVAYWPLIRDGDRDWVNGYHMTAFNAPSVAAHVPKVLYPAPAYSVGFAAAAPPAAAGLPVVSGEGVHSLVFGGVTVR